MVENLSVNIKQNSNDRDRVFKEYNKLFEDIIAQNSGIQDTEHFKILKNEETAINNRISILSKFKSPEKEESEAAKRRLCIKPRCRKSIISIIADIYLRKIEWYIFKIHMFSHFRSKKQKRIKIGRLTCRSSTDWLCASQRFLQFFRRPKIRTGT